MRSLPIRPFPSKKGMYCFKLHMGKPCLNKRREVIWEVHILLKLPDEFRYLLRWWWNERSDSYCLFAIVSWI